MEPGLGAEDNHNALSMDSKAKVPAGTPVGNHGDRRFRSLTWNDDVLMEILLRLPAKSIIRFKSVCKHWLSLFSSAKFCHLHTLRRPKLQPSLLLETPASQFFYFNPTTDGEKLMIPYTFPAPDLQIVSSCNGLMLLESTYYRVTEQSFHVYNPTTKRSREISLPDAHSDDDPVTMALALAFDPSKSPHYKVVCIFKEAGTVPETPTYQIKVYDSESRTWNISFGPFTVPEYVWILQGAYLNGSVYWSMLFGFCSYDIVKNEFKTFSRPNYPPVQDEGFKAFGVLHLEELNGHLYQSRLVTEGECQSIAVFELKMDDPSSWLLKYHHVISHENDIISQHQPAIVNRHAQPLRFLEGSNGTDTFSLVSHMSGKISLYNFLDKRSKELVDFTGQPFYHEDDNNMFVFERYEFGECLAVV